MTHQNDILQTEAKVIELGPTMFDLHNTFRAAIENEDQFVLFGLSQVMDHLRGHYFLTDEEELSLAANTLRLKLRSEFFGEQVSIRDKLSVLEVYYGMFNRAELAHACNHLHNN